MKTPIEFLKEAHLAGCPDMPLEIYTQQFHLIPKNIVFKAMEEYGKYCAEQAWDNRNKQSLNEKGRYVTLKFEDWWNKFNAKEETK